MIEKKYGMLQLGEALNRRDTLDIYIWRERNAYTVLYAKRSVL